MVFVSINSNNAEFIPTEEDFARYELLKKKDWVSLTEDERCFMGRVLIYINRQNAESFEELDEAIDSGDCHIDAPCFEGIDHIEMCKRMCGYYRRHPERRVVDVV